MLRACLLSASLLLVFSLVDVSAATAQQSPIDDSEEVRISLFDGLDVREVTIRADGDQLILRTTPDAPPLFELSAGESATIQARDDEIAVEAGDSGMYVSSLLAETSNNQPIQLRSTHTDAAYSGTLDVNIERPGSLQLVNTVPLRDYIASVVASEYGFDDLEGAKAMAVLARTYALYSSDKFGEAFDHVDHTDSQVYKGITAITDVSREATDATEGQILSYEGEPIEAVYFSSSGGHTASNEDVWDGSPLPYLRAQPDPYDVDTPHDEWRVEVSRPALLGHLSRHYGMGVSGFLVSDAGDDGRVEHVDLLSSGGDRQRISSNEFRRVVNQHLSDLGLRSTRFSASRSGDTYIFEGSGFGHGVGLSQYGAREMSRQGKSYAEILSFYFAGSELQGADLPTIAEERAAEPEEANEEEEPADDEPRPRLGW